MALTILALVLPIFAAGLILWPMSPEKSCPRDIAGALGPDDFETSVKSTMEGARRSGLKSAVFAVTLDDTDMLKELYGDTVVENIATQMRNRIRTTLRSEDVLGLWDETTCAICIKPQPAFDLETCLDLAGRLTQEISEPYAVDGATLYVTASLGFCQLGREVAKTADTDRDPVSICAHAALRNAVVTAPGAIRAFTPEISAPSSLSGNSELNPRDALENGEIIPWFQPQVSTDTGKITGFECLARWIHPSRGPIAPVDFLPQLESQGLMARLSEVILYHGMTALKAWDQAGTNVRQVGVNFSPAELNDPKLVEKISWELDRFELSPERLAIEILETVVAQGPDDVITRNIKGLSTLGCSIDLDDFGTGHASLASIRRFGVGRIKIDRSFVMKADRDVEQQRMIRAILMMAEKLNIETLAEGVETVGEHSLLAQLGCTHVQGFGIGRPMPFEDTMRWIEEHNAKLKAPPSIGRATG